MFKHVKKMALLLLCIPSLAYADRDSQEYKDCSAQYNDAIVEGKAEALKRHIIECQGKPDSDVLFLYSNNSYKQLDPISLTCLGDINSRRGLDLSYTFYKLAAERGSSKAKVSLGLMVEDEDIARRMDISEALQATYQNLAQEDQSFNFLRVMLLAKDMESREERQEFQTKYRSTMTEYGKQCVAALETDIARIDDEIQEMMTESDRVASRDVDAWVYVEGTMLEDKKRRLHTGLRQFQRMR